MGTGAASSAYPAAGKAPFVDTFASFHELSAVACALQEQMCGLLTGSPDSNRPRYAHTLPAMLSLYFGSLDSVPTTLCAHTERANVSIMIDCAKLQAPPPMRLIDRIRQQQQQQRVALPCLAGADSASPEERLHRSAAPALASGSETGSDADSGVADSAQYSKVPEDSREDQQDEKSVAPQEAEAAEHRYSSERQLQQQPSGHSDLSSHQQADTFSRDNLQMACGPQQDGMRGQARDTEQPQGSLLHQQANAEITQLASDQPRPMHDQGRHPQGQHLLPMLLPSLDSTQQLAADNAASVSSSGAQQPLSSVSAGPTAVAGMESQSDLGLDRLSDLSQRQQAVVLHMPHQPEPAAAPAVAEHLAFMPAAAPAVAQQQAAEPAAAPHMPAVVRHDDEPMAFEELVGLRGPIKLLFENAGTVIFSSALFMAAVLWVPFTCGRVTIRAIVRMQAAYKLTVLPAAAMQLLLKNYQVCMERCGPVGLQVCLQTVLGVM